MVFLFFPLVFTGSRTLYVLKDIKSIGCTLQIHYFLRDGVRERGVTGGVWRRFESHGTLNTHINSILLLSYLFPLVLYKGYSSKVFVFIGRDAKWTTFTFSRRKSHQWIFFLFHYHPLQPTDTQANINL
jgi:hypothetical protein